MSGTREATLTALLLWLNRHIEPEHPIGPDTTLFEGIIDSLRILELVAWVEVARGRVIPDYEIVMSSFATPHIITEVFIDE